MVTLISFIVTSSFTFNVNASSDEIIYPLKQISKLKCRFEEFDTLSSDCKRDLPILKTKDYKKYISQNGGYNEFTRIYTVLWGASYKYGWDKGHGGHTGIDIATAKGTPVYNIADGVVIVAKKDPSRGNVVSVKHMIKGKEVTSNYAHMSKINVKKGQKIKVGTKIGEVGSTGNSTGNHLHFQIDLTYTFHPYYYSWKACPYSYYKITESGICFDELATYTLDPLEFLENGGAVLDKLQINKVSKTSTKKVVQKKVVENKKINNNIVKGFDMSIFEKTIHNELNSSTSDVKLVQTIYKDLGYYKGNINGKYQDLESSLVDFQLKNKVIKTKNENGS
ncbi:MAG: peptidoglycan DD-metalloendopeptidase family protein [Candidatus Gracilibacteria bacterium]|nr:peptidoglycan DD-metalloendopeptidase family protein [Candidatus Gracilibacteria bacterium]